jgi:hypothetical protein
MSLISLSLRVKDDHLYEYLSFFVILIRCYRIWGLKPRLLAGGCGCLFLLIQNSSAYIDVMRS